MGILRTETRRLEVARCALALRDGRTRPWSVRDIALVLNLSERQVRRILADVREARGAGLHSSGVDESSGSEDSDVFARECDEAGG